MIWGIFSFKGTVGRLGFLVRALAIGLATFVVMLAVLLANAALNRMIMRMPVAYQWIEAGLAFAVMFVPYMWASLALIAKRLRSIGLSPAVFIALFIGLGFIQGGLVMPAFRHRELFGLYGLIALRVWDVLFLLVLFLWPQKSSLERRAVAAATFV